MKKYKILKKEFRKNDFSLLMHDEELNFKFWIDCVLMDGFGNKYNFEEEPEYIDWRFNQYIFDLTNSLDLRAKEYQENEENLENIQDFIDEIEKEIVTEYKTVREVEKNE